MHYVAPFVSSILFRLGGVGRDGRFLPFMKPPTPIAAKAWRWGMGIFIGALSWHGIVSFALTAFAYFLATWASGYGEKHPFRKWFGRDGAWIVYGFLFGLASLPSIGIGPALCQAVVGTWAFWALMKWSNDGWQKDGYPRHYLNHAWVEIGIGFLGTIFYL